MAKQINRHLGLLLLVLFALPFIGIGIHSIKSTSKTLQFWQQTQSWVETPCHILEAKLKSGSENTYRVTARYKYHWADREFQNDKVSVYSGSDNVGDFQERVAKELKTYLKNGKPFRCFVNPNDPSQAVLYRQLRTEMLWFRLPFCVLFPFSGIALIVYALKQWKKVSHHQKLQRDRLGKPWLWRDDWAQRLVTNDRWFPAFKMALFTLFANLIAWPLNIVFWQQPGIQVWVVVIVVLFPFMGIGLLSYTLYLLGTALRWKASQFQLATLPGEIGGKLSGVIHAPARLHSADCILLTLTCFAQRTRKTSDGDETYLVPIWQKNTAISQTLSKSSDSRAAIPVSFSIPDQCLQTDEEAGNSWQLEAHAEMPGIDYQATFEVPVFKTLDRSSDPAAENDQLLDEYQSQVPFEVIVRRSNGQIVSQSPSRYKIVFSQTRNPSHFITMMIFAIIWTSISLGLFFIEVPLYTKIAFSVYCFLLFGYLAWLGLNKTTLLFSDDGIQRQKGIPGRVKQHSLKTSEIKSISTKLSKLYTNDSTFQQIVLETHEGKKLQLVDRISRLSDAETLAETIQKTLGINDSPETKPIRTSSEEETPTE